MPQQDISIGVMPERLRAAVESSGMSAAEVARRIGVTNTAMQQWFSGEKIPSARNLGVLAQVTGQSVGYFYGEEGWLEDLRSDAENWRRVRAVFEASTSRVRRPLGGRLGPVAA